MMRKYIKVTIFIIVLLAIGYFAYYVYQAKQIIYVEALPIKRGAVTATVTATSSGIVKSRNDIVISSQILGRIDKFFVEEGDYVMKGETIALLEQKEAVAQVKLAEANLTSAKASLQQALADYDMIKALVQTDINEAKAKIEYAEKELQRASDLKDIISDGSIDVVRRKHEVARARYEACLANRTKIKVKEQEVESARAAIKQMEASLSVSKVNFVYTKITAPFTGLIAEILQEAGEFVSGGTPIVKLIDTSNLYIGATIDEFDIRKIKIGQAVKVFIDAFPEITFKGTLTKVLPVVSTIKTESRTSKVEIELNPGTDMLVKGLSADIEIIVGEANNILYVPTPAVMEKGNKRLVFVGNDGKVHQKEIKIGLSNWDYTEIKSGLIAGEMVITTLDDVNLKEGSRIKILNK